MASSVLFVIYNNIFSDKLSLGNFPWKKKKSVKDFFSLAFILCRRLHHISKYNFYKELFLQTTYFDVFKSFDK
jgi:hypothetical protein